MTAIKIIFAIASRRLPPAAALCLLLCLPAASPTHGQTNYLVAEVDIRGNETFSDDHLKKQVAVHGKGGFLGLFQNNEEFSYNEDALADDVKRLRRFYQREGFLDAAVTYNLIHVNHKDREVTVVFHITEGNPVIVRHMGWSLPKNDPAASEQFDRIDSILRKIEGERALTTGVRFRDDAAKADQELQARELADHGYPYALVIPRLGVDTTAMRVDVAWRIEPGPLSSFGTIAVSGNDHIPSSSITKQLAFKSGDRFDQSLLDRSQDRVYGLGAFRVVTIIAETDSSRKAVVPVRINVVEAPRFSTEFGVGYGREEEFRVHNHSRFIGFLGATPHLDLELKHSALEPYHARLSWTKPAFLTPLTGITLVSFARRQTEPGFTVNRYGGDIELTRNFNRHLDGSVTYVFEQVGLDRQSVSPEALAGTQLDLLYNKSSVTVGISADMSSPSLSPSRGMRVSASVQASGLDLGSRYHFYKTLLEIRHYQQMRGFVLATRAKWGGIKSVDADRFVPVEERFFAGGSKSVRGWSRSELGPIMDGKPIGGNALAVGSLELRHGLFWQISGAAFMDAGNVWEKVQGISLAGIRYSAGAGLRYRTPIGPIRLDLARPVWDEVHKWQVHISVGEAF